MMDLCGGDWRTSLILDYCCHCRLISEKCAEFEEWPSIEYMLRPHYFSISPRLVRQLIGGVLTEPEISNAFDHLIRYQYLTKHPVITHQATLNAGYLTKKSEELSACH
jgi:hypothetical protein